MGRWRGPRTPRDPLLTTHHWRITIRGHWLRLRLPCQCGQCGSKPIDYDGPRYLIINGSRRLNPNYLVVGHIVSRYQAKRLGWTEQQTNALTNTRPERQACSNRSGARLGQKVQATRSPATPRLDEISRW